MTRGVPERIRHELRESPAAPAGLLALAVILVWAARDGGTSALVWAPGTLLLVGLLAVVVLAAPGPLPGGRLGVVAIGAFAAFVGWSYLSMLWADVEADAWSGANTTLAYFAVYALFATRPWNGRAAMAVLGGYSLGVTAIGLWQLVSLAASDQAASGFIEGRLGEPISYANANCALYLGAAIPALTLAARRELPVVLRGVFLGVAGILGQLALLCQSRMSLFALPLVLVAYLLLVPGRLRSLLTLALVGLGSALAAPRVLHVYEVVLDGGDVRAAVASARDAVLVVGGVLFLLGVVWGVLDRRLTVPGRVSRALGVAAVVAAGLALIGAAGLFVDRYGDPVDRVGIWWDRFRDNEYVSEPGTPHIVSGFGGAGRYDIWRVALQLFRDHPLTGIGVDNFSVDFLRERTVDNSPKYPHSVELRMLQQTGVIGTGLVVAFLVAAVAAGWRGLRGSVEVRGVSASALLVFGYWLVHGSIDWLWEIPALSGGAFAALGVYVAVGGERRERRAVRPAVVAVAVLVVVAVVSVGAAWSSARDVDAAVETWRASPAEAYRRLDRARSFDPFSDEPDVLAAVIAAQVGDVSLQRERLQRVLERNPYNWYAYLELGLIEARRGRRTQALDWIDRAAALNPLEETIAFARSRVDGGSPPSQAEMDAFIRRTAEPLTGETG